MLSQDALKYAWKTSIYYFFYDKYKKIELDMRCERMRYSVASSKVSIVELSEVFYQFLIAPNFPYKQYRLILWDSFKNYKEDPKILVKKNFKHYLNSFFIKEKNQYCTL